MGRVAAGRSFVSTPQAFVRRTVLGRELLLRLGVSVPPASKQQHDSEHHANGRQNHIEFAQCCMGMICRRSSPVSGCLCFFCSGKHLCDIAGPLVPSPI